MTEEDMLAHLLTANEVALAAVENGTMPFGAVLVAPNGKDVLLRQGNVDAVRHAESELARQASEAFSPEFLWQCTLVTTFEPCAMCAGTLYWANIGKLVYGVEEKVLLGLTGNHEDNPTMDLSCRTVLASGQKNIEIWGPFKSLEKQLVQPHVDFWK